MAAAKTPPPPRLGTDGRRLWKQVTDDYELTAPELHALTAACRSLDELVILETALDEAPTIVTGSAGQQQPNKLFAEVRAHRAALAKHLLDAGLADAHGVSASTAGRRLVGVRYGRSG